MAFKFNGDITLVDIMSLGSAAIVGLYVIFGMQASLDALAQEQNHIKKDVVRIEEAAKAADTAIIVELKEQGKESKEQFQKVDGKLDKVIEHLINTRE